MKTNSIILNENDKSCVGSDLLKLVQAKAFIPNANEISTNLTIKKPIANEVHNSKNEEQHKILSEKPNSDIVKKHITKTEPIDDKKEINLQTNEYNDFLNIITLFLENLCKKLNLEEEISSRLIKELQSFINSFLDNIRKEEAEHNKMLCFHLKKILGNGFKNKMFLIKRASAWLNLNNLDNSDGYLSFLYKMIELGSILSEDQGVRNEHNNALLSKEEAKTQRNVLTSDEKFKQALINKAHPLHKDALNKLRNLNRVIVT